MDIKYKCCNPEIWGGIECTINRTGNRFLDQLADSGHYDRAGDIELISTLGIRALRYPVLWERHEPEKGKEINWTWIEKQLHAIREFNVNPIAGLIHHGSGPAHTGLHLNSFASGLAAYAGKVAEKFPWLEYYTPVNEPLTTARFSGLYGYWYPHKNNDAAFIKMLLNQVKAVVLSMKEIRKVNSSAKLVQTEDLAKTYSCPSLRYQADFENERRWLTNDLLCGKVDADHSLWDYFMRIGIPEKLFGFFLDNPCPPDIIGCNYYVTSERFLDDDINRYPPHMHGGNWVERYVDTELVRVRHNESSGAGVLLREAWDRYEIPLALTEVHINCSREEQLRWFNEIYNTACELVQQGIPVKAVTAWSLFGAYGWNRLLTEPGIQYESGVFDLRSKNPRPTALAKLIRTLSSGKKPDHPLLWNMGWWNRDIRFLHNAVAKNDFLTMKRNPILIVGKRGTLGKAFARICELRGINYFLAGRDHVDLSKKEMIENIINRIKPWAIINAAGFVRVDDAETEIENCYRDNTTGPENLADCCNAHGIKLLTFSSDLVFDGLKNATYVESDLPQPLNVYGHSKAEKEKRVLEKYPDALIIRTSAFFGPWDQYNFASHVIRQLEETKEFRAADDLFISPTYVPDLVNTSMDLLIDDEKGIWHIANNGTLSWFEFAIQVADRAGFNLGMIRPCAYQSFQWPAKRPVFSALTSERGIFLPAVEDALDRYFLEKNEHGVPEHQQAI